MAGRPSPCPPAAPSWSTTSSTWSTPAPQRTSIWSSRPPPSCCRGRRAGRLSRSHRGFGKNWIGGAWEPTSGSFLRAPQGPQERGVLSTFPLTRSFSLCPPLPPLDLLLAPCFCLCPSLCLQTLALCSLLGVRTGRVVEEAETRGGWWHQAPRPPPPAPPL